MAVSTCANCEEQRFELKEVSPIGSKFKMLFIQCAACGVPVGTEPYVNAAVQVQAIDEKIDRLMVAVGDIATKLRRVASTVDDLEAKVKKLKP